MTVNDFNNRIRFGSLYEMYGSLLTKKQQRCLELYFYEDYSLAEIADEMQVSRQAVHDLLKRVEQALEQYEKMLGFFKRTETSRRLLDEAQRLLEETAAVAGVSSCGSSNKLGRVREILHELNNEGR